MTKSIRIENADLSTYKVVVEVWNRGAGGQADTLDHVVPLHSPTQMTTVGIHSHRYLVVKEVQEPTNG